MDIPPLRMAFFPGSHVLSLSVMITADEIHELLPLRRIHRCRPVIMPRPFDGPHPFHPGQRTEQCPGVPERDDIIPLSPHDRDPSLKRFKICSIVILVFHEPSDRQPGKVSPGHRQKRVPGGHEKDAADPERFIPGCRRRHPASDGFSQQEQGFPELLGQETDSRLRIPDKRQGRLGNGPVPNPRTGEGADGLHHQHSLPGDLLGFGGPAS